MSIHEVEFSYSTPEWSSIEIDLDPALDAEEKEDVAFREVEEVYPDAQDINITSIREI